MTNGNLIKFSHCVNPLCRFLMVYLLMVVVIATTARALKWQETGNCLMFNQ